MQGGKKVPQVIQVTRTQLPIVPAFAITTYKAQGLTMNRIVVDLQVLIVEGFLDCERKCIFTKSGIGQRSHIKSEKKNDTFCYNSVIS
jgi:hypothetical protein